MVVLPKLSGQVVRSIIDSLYFCAPGKGSKQVSNVVIFPFCTKKCCFHKIVEVSSYRRDAVFSVSSNTLGVGRDVCVCLCALKD